MYNFLFKVFVMEIIIQRKASVRNKSTGALNPFKSMKRRKNKNHRKNRHDRRKSLRDGIIVSLSIKSERRQTCGRRKTDYQV